MRIMPRLIAFAMMGFLLSLPFVGAQDKKGDAKKDEPAKKADVKKDADKAKDKDKDKDAEKPKEKPAKTPKEKPAKKPIIVGTIAGKVMAVVEAKKQLRIELTIGKQKKPVEWYSTDEVKVRFGNEALLPPKFDDKGKPSRYTRKELRELKGDDKKTPGYPAEFSDLKPGQYVQVTLVRKNGKPPRPVRGVQPDPNGEFAPHMSLIVIVTPAK